MTSVPTIVVVDDAVEVRTLVRTRLTSPASSTSWAKARPVTRRSSSPRGSGRT